MSYEEEDTCHMRMGVGSPGHSWISGDARAV
jgi:hypothetical protein